MPVLQVVAHVLVNILSVDRCVVVGDLLLSLDHVVTSLITVQTFVVLTRGHCFLAEWKSFRMRVDWLALLP